MYGMFSKKTVQVGLVCANLAALTLATINMFRNPENWTEFALDGSIHMLNIIFLEDRIPAPAQKLAALANYIQLFNVVGNVGRGAGLCAISLGVADVLFHAVNAAVLQSGELANMPLWPQTR